MTETLTTVRKTTTTKAPKWTRSTDSIISCWEDRSDAETVAPMQLGDRLEQLFFAACYWSALPVQDLADDPDKKLFLDALGEIERTADGRRSRRGRRTALLGGLRRIAYGAIEDGSIHEIPDQVWRDGSWRRGLAGELWRALATTRSLQDVCDGISALNPIIARRVERSRPPRRRRSALESWNLHGNEGAESVHRRKVDLAITAERVRQGQLLAGIVGPDWHLAPEWRTDTAVQIARTVYDRREFHGMPILADALQDAGCVNEPWLARMRDRDWPWCRGCHVLDSLLPELVHAGV